MLDDFHALGLTLSGILLMLAGWVFLLTEQTYGPVLEFSTESPPMLSLVDGLFPVIFHVDEAGAVHVESRTIDAPRGGSLASARCAGEPERCSVVLLADDAAPAGVVLTLLDSLYAFTPTVLLADP